MQTEEEAMEGTTQGGSQLKVDGTNSGSLVVVVDGPTDQWIPTIHENNAQSLCLGPKGAGGGRKLGG